MKKDAMITLQAFEVDKLNLEGAEVIAYAILYKATMFCNNKISHDFFRSLCNGIEEWNDVLFPGLLIDLNTVIDKLIAKGLVEKTREGVRVYDNLED